MSNQIITRHNIKLHRLGWCDWWVWALTPTRQKFCSKSQGRNWRFGGSLTKSNHGSAVLNVSCMHHCICCQVGAG